MANKRFWTAFFFLLVALTASAAGEHQLQLAKDAMNRGDFRFALGQFRDLSMDSYVSPRIAREASYFVGFCCVKMSDPWGAIEALERFLGRYQSSSSDFLIPDALYVLGRTYENVNRIDDARRVYRRCRDRFAGSEFASKSEDRLRLIGGGDGGHYPPPPPPPPGPGYHGVSPEIADMIRLAKMDPNSYSADQMLLKAASRARNGQDFVAISRATSNQYTQWQIISTAMQSRVFARMIPFDVVDLARTTSNSYYRNQLLLAYAKNVAQTAEDFSIITEAATDSYTKSQILAIAREKVGNGGHHPNYAMEPGRQYADQGPDAAPAAKATPVEKASPSDPFSAGFDMDQEKVRRVNWFIKAVQSKKEIEATAKQLQKEDMGLDIVRQALKSADQMKKFDSMHQR
ncbi:MAG: hypothetical protein GX442_08280 [Candidatus Riflebacteria bacterium]|nr:hypothetical protein [Candidatus Riflebacteria bacterium]